MKEDKDNTENFEVTIASDVDDDTTVVTSFSDFAERWISEAVDQYDSSNRKYSVYLSDDKPSTEEITPKLLDELSENAQNDLTKILKINGLIRKAINRNDIVGKTVESIDTNINTTIKLIYPNVDTVSGKGKNKQLDNAKAFVDQFNTDIKLSKLIHDSVTTTYAEGNYIIYLRHENNQYSVNYYPLGVCEISDYEIKGEPVVLFNIQELRKRLQKVYRKTKKKKFLFFRSMDEEVKANYPPEVYEAFKNKEDCAKLDVLYTGVIRIGDLKRKYGLSSIFRALEPLSMLETFNNSDRVNSKAKAKKIIHQKLRKEVLGKEYNKPGFEEMAYAHQNFMSAWKQPTVVVTTPPTVETIQYVEPKVEMTKTETINDYRSRVLTTLGISFLMDTSSQSVSTASISVTQLMRLINKISEQLEEILNRWYQQVFIDNNMNVQCCPKIQIIDSEALDFELRKSLATVLYTIFNGSLESSLEILGIDINDETSKRQKENEANLDEVFYPRATSHTTSGNEHGLESNQKQSGRPKSKTETSKTKYDETYNKEGRK